MCHNYWACTLEPTCRNFWAHLSQLLKPTGPGACALQQERPLQWEAHTPELLIESSTHSPQLEKVWAQQRRPSTAQKKKKKNPDWSMSRKSLTPWRSLPLLLCSHPTRGRRTTPLKCTARKHAFFPSLSPSWMGSLGIFKDLSLGPGVKSRK